MQRRDDRHGQPRKQRHDVAAGFTAENTEFMLEGNGVEPARIQKAGRADIILYPFIPDLMADGGRIAVDVTVDRSSPRCRFPRRVRAAIACCKSVVKVAIPQWRGQ